MRLIFLRKMKSGNGLRTSPDAPDCKRNGGITRTRMARHSLDRCSKNPCSYPVALNTDRHYRAMFSIPVPEDRTPER